MADTSPAARRKSRLSPLLHSASTAVMLVALVPLVLRAAQAEPPAIAEFAPQVQQPIKDAPDRQTSALGSGEGGTNGLGGGLPSPTPLPTDIKIPPGARVNKCVGAEGRQIEDPQSPPCIPFWSGDNGGATSFGVTDTTITVAMPDWSINNGAGDMPTFINFFNDRFEFYGRKLVLKTFPSNQGQTPAQMEADATYVRDQLQAFAEITYPWQFGAEGVFYDALARRGIISIQGTINGMATSDTAHLESFAPYEWNYVQTPDVVLRNVAEMVCKQLANKAPSHAGSPTNLAQKRKFGILRGVRPGFSPFEDSYLSDGIKNCTGVAPEHIDYSTGDTQEIGTVIAQFNANSVTSIICVCVPTDLVYLMTAAQGQSYYPEWIVHNVVGQDGVEGMFLEPSSQSQHAFGIRSLNKEVPVSQTPYIWAIHYESPSNPKPPYQNTYNYWDEWPYHDLLLLASGIQMAGPNLTPKTFEEGLFRTRFPNPGCDGPPFYQACVGFEGGSHTMQKSFGMVWWDPEQQNGGGASGYPGNYCDVDRGVRFSLGSWPSTDRYQQSGPCK